MSSCRPKCQRWADGVVYRAPMVKCWRCIGCTRSVFWDVFQPDLLVLPWNSLWRTKIRRFGRGEWIGFQGGFVVCLGCVCTIVLWHWALWQRRFRLGTFRSPFGRRGLGCHRSDLRNNAFSRDCAGWALRPRGPQPQNRNSGVQRHMHPERSLSRHRNWASLL